MVFISRGQTAYLVTVRCTCMPHTVVLSLSSRPVQRHRVLASTLKVAFYRTLLYGSICHLIPYDIYSLLTRPSGAL